MKKKSGLDFFTKKLIRAYGLKCEDGFKKLISHSDKEHIENNKEDRIKSFFLNKMSERLETYVGNQFQKFVYNASKIHFEKAKKLIV